jgi:hypothetical protein
MEYLFTDLVIPSEAELPRFREPTHREAAQWLRQSEGVWSNELLRWLDRPEVAGRVVCYTGTLSLAQQWWIICDLQNKT